MYPLARSAHRERGLGGEGELEETIPMPMTPETAPYGTWRSPITTDLITGQRVGVVSPRIDGDDVYWIENRPGRPAAR